MSCQKFTNWIAFIIILEIYCIVQIITAKENFCYDPVFVSTSYTDNRPDFKVNMTFGDHGGLTSLMWVTKEVKSPTAHLRIIIKEGKNHVPPTLYNVTARLCDINSMIKKIPMLQQVFQTVVNQGNFSFDCPLSPGFYALRDIRIASRSPMLGWMYRPKTVYTFIGGLFDEAKNKTLLPLNTFDLSFKIVKIHCK